MRRPGLNKNEGIRINIEQRYILEDRFSKQGKLKACEEDAQREKNKVLLPGFRGLLFTCIVHRAFLSQLAQPHSSKDTPSTVWRIHGCAVVLIVCLLLWCDNRM